VARSPNCSDHGAPVTAVTYVSLVTQVRISTVGIMLTMTTKVTKVATVNFVIKLFVSAIRSSYKVPVIFVQF
jgi:hypothetical protein